MYDQYVKKIQRIARIKRVYHRYRFFVWTSTLLALVASTGLVSAKGIVSDAIKLATTYVYGEEIVFRSSAFLSDVEYEFAKVDSEQWTNIKPHLVGDYKMRSKGSNSFNDYYYGNEQTFSIVPKKVVFSPIEEEIMYGITPTINVSDQLSFGDRLLDNYQFSYQNIETSTWTTMPRIDSLRILSVENEDVTYCYDLEAVAKDIQILKRPLAILTHNSEKIYDGSPLSKNSYTITSGTLVEGDSIGVVASTSRTDVGISANSLAFIIQNQEGVDVTLHYQIMLDQGQIKIAKRPITFTSRSFEYTYDGLDHAYGLDDLSIAPTSSLLSSHEVRYTILKDKSFIRAGTYQNAFKVDIYEGEVNVSHNYDISYQFGTTTIEPRAIDIISPSLEKTYDKQEVHLTDYVIQEGTSLANKDRLEIVDSPTYTDSGTYTLHQTCRIVDQVTEEDFSDSYLMNVTDGSIVIQKIKLPVEIIKDNPTYDGKYHSNLFSTDESLLAKGDAIVLQDNLSEIHVGEYDNNELKIDIIDENGISNLHNYDIEIIGKEKALTISKRAIGIEILSKNKIYDAQSIQTGFSEDESTFALTSGSLADGDYIDFSYLNDPSDAGIYPINSELKIYHQIGEVKNGDQDLDVTSNYEIDLSVGDFVIDKRELVITTLDSEQIYNRTLAIPTDEVLYKVDEGNLVEGHQIHQLGISFEGVNVGTYPYLIDGSSLVIVDQNALDVSDNYAPIFVNTGKRTIHAREYQINMLEDSQTYDGKPFSSSKHEAIGLLENDWIEIDGLSEVTHVFEGKIKNPTDDYQVHIYTNNNEEVTDNYILSGLVKNDIYVTPRKISLSSESITKTFDGKVVGETKVTITSGSLAEGDTLTINNLASLSVKHVNESQINRFEYAITNETGLDVREDYDISIDFGYIRVKPFEVTVEFEEYNLVYNGISHSFSHVIELSRESDGLYIIDGTVPEGYHLYASLWSSNPMIYAGDYGKPAFYTWHAADEGNFYESDYVIHYQEADTLVVNQRPITIQSVSGSKVYDGQVFDQTCIISSGDLAEGDYIVYGPVTGLVKIGSNMDNPIGEITIYNQYGIDVTSSYKISKIYGKVTIYEKVY